jgi:hypothetical protein
MGRWVKWAGRAGWAGGLLLRVRPEERKAGWAIRKDGEREREKGWVVFEL